MSGVVHVKKNKSEPKKNESRISKNVKRSKELQASISNVEKTWMVKVTKIYF